MITQDAFLFIILVMYLFFFTYRRFQLLCCGGGQLDGLRESHLGVNVGDSHMSVCRVKRMAATLRTE